MERQDEDKIVELEYEKNHAEMEKKAWPHGKLKFQIACFKDVLKLNIR